MRTPGTDPPHMPEEWGHVLHVGAKREEQSCRLAASATLTPQAPQKCGLEIGTASEDPDVGHMTRPEPYDQLVGGVQNELAGMDSG